MTSVSSSNSTELGHGVSALKPAEPTGTTEHPLAVLSRSGPRPSTIADHQAGLHQIGRRLGLRAVRAFRDDTNLAVNPDLWGTAPKNPATRRAVWRMSAVLSALAISLLGCSTPSANLSQRHENTPSAGGSYATTAQVLEAVKAAEQVQTLSDTVATSLREPDDGGASGCFDRLDTHKPAVLQAHQPASDIDFGECAYGAQDGTKLMVMFGDSRAYMLVGPARAHRRKGWLEAASIWLRRLRS